MEQKRRSSATESPPARIAKARVLLRDSQSGRFRDISSFSSESLTPRSMHRSETRSADRDAANASSRGEGHYAIVKPKDIVVLDIEFEGLDAAGLASVRQLSERLPSLVLEASEDSLVRRARALVDAYPLPNPIADIHLEQYRRELLTRQDFMRQYPCRTAADVAETAQHDNPNRSQTAYRWKSEDRIFAVPGPGNRDVYPSFQFGEDGKPLPIIAQLLKRLKPYRSPWSIAHWFVSPNGDLNELCPIDLLNTPTAHDKLIDAAEQEVADEAQARSATAEAGMHAG